MRARIARSGEAKTKMTLPLATTWLATAQDPVSESRVGGVAKAHAGDIILRGLLCVADPPGYVVVPMEARMLVGYGRR